MSYVDEFKEILQLDPVVLDTETTGMSKDDVVIEVAAVNLAGETLFYSLINHEGRKRSSPQALKVHGIGDSVLRRAPVFHRVMDELLRAIGDRPIIAHNSKFDDRLLRQTFEFYQTPAPRWRWFDSLGLAKEMYAGESKHSVEALAARFGLKVDAGGFHGALYDSQVLSHILCMMAEEVGTEEEPQIEVPPVIAWSSQDLSVIDERIAQIKPLGWSAEMLVEDISLKLSKPVGDVIRVLEQKNAVAFDEMFELAYWPDLVPPAAVYR